MKPEVSVLLPMYNAASTIDTCLRSLARQRGCDWECVIVDDGSTDESALLVKAIAARDSRIRLIPSEHAGLVETLNLGLRECRAGVVARMDADDIMHRDRLATQLAVLKSHLDLAAVGCHVRIFPKPTADIAIKRALPGETNRVRTGRGGYAQWLNSFSTPEGVSNNAYVECPVAHPTLVIRREALETYRYRDMGWAEDYDLILRMLGAGESLGVVPRRLLSWRDHARRLSRTHPDYGLERFVACKAHHLARTLLKGRKDYVLWGYGGTGRAMAKALAKLDLAPSHIVELHPRRIGETIRGAKVIHPDDLSKTERTPLIASVAGAGPRGEIRKALALLDYQEGRDFVCAA